MKDKQLPGPYTQKLWRLQARFNDKLDKYIGEDRTPLKLCAFAGLLFTGGGIFLKNYFPNRSHVVHRDPIVQHIKNNQDVDYSDDNPEVIEIPPVEIDNQIPREEFKQLLTNSGLDKDQIKVFITDHGYNYKDFEDFIKELAKTDERLR